MTDSKELSDEQLRQLSLLSNIGIKIVRFHENTTSLVVRLSHTGDAMRAGNALYMTAPSAVDSLWLDFGPLAERVAALEQQNKEMRALLWEVVDAQYLGIPEDYAEVVQAKRWLDRNPAPPAKRDTKP